MCLQRIDGVSNTGRFKNSTRHMWLLGVTATYITREWIHLKFICDKKKDVFIVSKPLAKYTNSDIEEDMWMKTNEPQLLCRQFFKHFALILLLVVILVFNYILTFFFSIVNLIFKVLFPRRVTFTRKLSLMTVLVFKNVCLIEFSPN